MTPDDPPEDLERLSPEAARRLLHELRVHQIELETQNEELRVARAALDASHARYVDLYDLAPVAYCTVSERNVVLRANHAAASLLGVPRSSLVGAAFTTFILPDDQDLYYLQRRAVAWTDAARACELRMVRGDGAPIAVHLAVTATEDDTGAPVFRVVLIDQSERKSAEAERARLETRLRQAEKLESIGLLAGGVAHNFNNLLAVILASVDFALDELDPAHPVHEELVVLEELVQVRAAAVRAAELAQGLLTYAGRQVIQPRVLDLNAAMAETLKLLRRLIGADIEVRWRPGAGPLLVNLDPAQADQILTDLCVNARHAIADVGTIDIETATVVVGSDLCATNADATPGDYVRLTVRDSGCGMSAETQSHLFEPFFTTREVGRGTGLGLAAVHGAVRQNHGFIMVSSALDEGTVFEIYLPRAAAEPSPVPAAVPTEPGNATILVVDDEPQVLRITARILRARGYTVVEANGALEALRVAQEHPGELHLILTDLNMPEMNGRDLVAKLLPLHPRASGLFMSGFAADVLSTAGLSEDAAKFIEKPFSTPTLLAKVRQALGA